MPPLFAISWDWITQNLEIVLPIVLFLIFNVFSRSKEESESAPPPQVDRRPMQQPQPQADPGDGLTPEQRAEQIREEIRRRIQERMGQKPVPPPVPVEEQMEPEPPEELPSWLREEEPERETVAAPSAPPPLPAAASVQEETPFPSAPVRETMSPSHGLESFSEQFRQMEEARKLAASTAMQIRGGNFPGAQETRQVAVGAGGRNAASLRAELKDREGARRALVLREVLDTPVSLRR
jgi:hypothetical protein